MSIKNFNALESVSRTALIAALVASAGTASAGVNSWVSPVDGFWDVGANWSTGIAPGSLDSASIAVAGAYTATIRSGIAIEELSISNVNAVLDIQNSRALTIASASAATAPLVNDGMIVLNSNQGSSFTQFSVGDADTQGIITSPGSTGEIVLNIAPGNGDLNDALLNILGNGLHGQGHTIRGKGRVAGTFTNDGIILADRIDDELRISANMTQNPGGIVRATAGGFLGIGDDGIVNGGMMLTDTDGKIRFPSGTGTLMGGAHNMGDVEVLNSRAMQIDTGGITNDGTITLNSNQGSSFTQINVIANTSILGSGIIDLNIANGNGDLNDARLTTTAATATNGVNHSITGKGHLSGTWINDGTIEADRDGQELRISADVVQSATGSIGAVNNGVLGIAQNGRVSGGSIITGTGGSVQTTTGIGTIDGGINNTGSMGVRNSTTLELGAGGMANNGTITINSNQGNNLTSLLITDTATFSGMGTIDLNVADANSDLNDARLITDIGVTATLGVNQNVTGKGHVTGDFINNGTINADRTGQDLQISGTVAQGPAGTIMGSGGGFITLQNAAITGGFFDGVTGGAVLAIGGVNTISGVTSLGASGVRNAGGLNILAGGFTNNGVCTINSQPGNNATFLQVTQTATIDGNGIIDLNIADTNSDFNDAVLSASVGQLATHGPNHTISGKGRIEGDWINNGTITGNRPGQDLRIGGTYDQSAGGVIRGDNAGAATLQGAAVTGGTFDSALGGSVQVQSGGNSISGVNNLNTAGVRNAALLDILAGGLTNDGILTINSNQGSSQTAVTVAQNATIDGLGEIIFNIADANSDFNDAQLIAAAGIAATHGVAHTISGKGRLAGDWINHGTIVADCPGQDLQILNATITQSATGVLRGENNAAIAIINSTITGGQFESDTGGSVLFGIGASTAGNIHNLGNSGLRNAASVDLLATGMTNDGTFTINSNTGSSITAMTATADAMIDGAGTIHLGISPPNSDFNDAQLGAADGSTLTLGPDQTITGKGRLFGDVVLEGTLSPGVASIDTIRMNTNGVGGSLTMTATTEYAVEASAEEINDRLDATVPVTIAGTLRFTPIEGFDPPRPTRYTIMTGPEFTGTFDTLIYEGIVPEGGVFRVVYEDTEVIAAVTCKADIAAPIGVLDLSDITLFTQLFLIQSPLVDLAPPMGVLDLADITTFITEFLAGCNN